MGEGGGGEEKGKPDTKPFRKSFDTSKIWMCHILGDPGAVSRVYKMFVVKVYCKIETSPWALTLTEPVPEAFELPASDWPEKIFSFYRPD